MTASRIQTKASGRLTFTVINKVIQLPPALCRSSAPPPPGPAPPALSLPITLKHLKVQNRKETSSGQGDVALQAIVLAHCGAVTLGRALVGGPGITQ